MTTPNNGQTTLGRITSIDIDFKELLPHERNAIYDECMNGQLYGKKPDTVLTLRGQKQLQIIFNCTNLAAVRFQAVQLFDHIRGFDEHIVKTMKEIGEDLFLYGCAKIDNNVLYLNVYRGRIVSDEPKDCRMIEPFTDYDLGLIWFTDFGRQANLPARIETDPKRRQVHTCHYVYKDPVFSIALNRPE